MSKEYEPDLKGLPKINGKMLAINGVIGAYCKGKTLNEKGQKVKWQRVQY